ncbi:MAG: ABC transporter permease [Paracoccaceae bacterium]|uniref:ABC transporter permease n=1 Tax=Candidatus Salinivivens marinus TaxID=3381703 RepID=UPI000B6E8323|nr:ABC transporter permease [Marinovum sp.]OUU12973.1 MAG: ABC transporter permease [Rhodobacteraceae bacterium TMED38]PDH60417.1 MAG: ABC transporter permease [Rhodobacteraceae bacterium MED-G08]
MSERNESDRLQEESWIQRMIRRPEIGSFIVMIIIILALGLASEGKAFNALGLKNNIAIIAQLGIIAVGAALLMIAGEFDLSIGPMIAFAGMSMAIMLKWGLPFGLGEATPFTAFIITMCMTLGFGWLIGTIVVRSGLSSFIVTLAFWFFLRGLTEVCFRLINQNTNVSGLPDFKQESWFAEQMGGEVFGWLYDAWFWIGQKVAAGLEFTAGMTKDEKIDLINYLSFLNINRKMEQWVTGFDARLLWFIIIAGVAWYVLAKTQIGNWIYATGDNKESARANGVPVNRVKVGLFMFSAFCATIFAACQVFDTNSSDAAKGMFKELEAIAIAVVGGILMTGGFGSIVGVIFGAVTFGLVANAVFFIPWIDGAWFRVFVGTVLLAAVFANERIRKRITGGI